MEPTFFKSPAEFRKWLEKNHDTSLQLLVGFHRKDSGQGGITYPEALDEALCFGWIDGLRKRLDEASYSIRFTPRKRDSIWSAVNTNRIAELKKLGRLHASGLRKFQNRDIGKSKLYSYERATCKFDAAYEEQFRANRKAWEFYQAQPPYYRRGSCWWVMSAKQESTRLRRLEQLVADSGKGRRIKQFVNSATK